MGGWVGGKEKLRGASAEEGAAARTEIPALRTFAMVCRRSSYERVVITLP